jgi:hypothetical protein
MWESRRMNTYWSEVRGLPPAASLQVLGRFALGRNCHIAAGGIVLRAAGDRETPVFDRFGQPVTVSRILPRDRAIAALGIDMLEVAQGDVGAATPAGDRVALLTDVGALVFRGALLTRMLGLAFAHLETRESGGQRTLQLPLVKATFTACASLADRNLREAARHLEGMPGLDLAAAHQVLTEATSDAAKLMGGHGFLLGSLHSIETLSLLIGGLFAPAAERLVAA